MVVEASSAVCGADPGSEDEHVTLLESDGGLDDDLSHRVQCWIFDEIPYLTCQLSVFILGNLPRGTQGRLLCGGARLDQELDGRHKHTN